MLNYFKDNKKFKATEKAIEKHGFKVMFLIRLNPATPYGIMNYMVGVTAVPFWVNFTAYIGIIPVMAFEIYMGT